MKSMRKVISAQREPNPQKVMSVVDHLRELRYRLLMSLAFISCTTIIGFIWYAQSFSVPHFHWAVPSLGQLLSKPYCDIPSPPRAQITQDHTCKLLSLSPFDQFFLRFKVALVAGIIMACPIWFYHLWRFIAPGLKKNEKRYSVFFVTTSASLFLIGSYLAFLVLPQAFNFLLRIGDNVQVTAMQGDKYFSFVINLLIIFGVSFEFPIIIIALNWVRILPARTLNKFQRGIIFGIFVFAAFATPGQDPFSMIVLAGSLTILFEFSVVVAVTHDKLLQRRERKRSEENFAHLSDGAHSPLETPRDIDPPQSIDDSHHVAYRDTDYAQEDVI